MINLNDDKILELLIDEKKVTSEELRYYSSFMYKFVPIFGSIILATFGYALKGNGLLILFAIPLLINIFAVILLYINYNMILLDGFVRVIENALNEILGIDIYKKNTKLLSILYGGDKTPIPFLFKLNVSIILIIIMSIYFLSLFYSITIQNEILTVLWKWVYILFCGLTPFIHIATYATMTKRIDSSIRRIREYYKTEITKHKIN